MEQVIEILKTAKSYLRNNHIVKTASNKNLLLTSIEGDNVYIDIMQLDKDQASTYMGNYIRGVFSIDGFYFNDLEPNSQTKLEKFYDGLSVSHKAETKS